MTPPGQIRTRSDETGFDPVARFVLIPTCNHMATTMNRKARTMKTHWKVTSWILSIALMGCGAGARVILGT